MADEMLPRDRAELLWEAIVNHTIEAVDAIRDRPELIAAAIAAGLPDMLGDPRDRYELFLKAIAGAQGGTGGIDDSVAGYDVLYEAHDLVFNGLASTFINTGIKLLGSDYQDKDIKIVIKDLSYTTGGNNYSCLLHCKHEVDPWPGIKIARGNMDATGSDFVVEQNTRCDLLVFRRDEGAWNAQLFNSTPGNKVAISVPRFDVDVFNESPLVLGGALNANGGSGNFGFGGFGSIIVAVK